MGNLFCLKTTIEKETRYGDYIFHHEELLKIKVSHFLASNIKIDDFISLKVCFNGKLCYHNCRVHYKKENEIYISFIQSSNEYSEIEYVKKL